jgi:hypothetical protein
VSDFRRQELERHLPAELRLAGLIHDARAAVPIVRMAEPGKAKATGKPDPSAVAINTISMMRKTISITVAYLLQAEVVE